MYEPMNQASYTTNNNPYFSGQTLPQTIQNPSFSYPQFQSISTNPSVSLPPAHGFTPFPAQYPSNVPGYGAQPVSYSDPGPSSANWVVKQSAPVKYSPAIQPLSYNPSPSNNLIHQISSISVPKGKVKRPKAIPKSISASQTVRCQLCSIDCNTVEMYEKHLSGKKHSKGLLKLYAPASQLTTMQSSQSGQVTAPGAQSMPGVATKPVNLEVKKQKLVEGGAAVQSVRVCAICNVACNGDVAFADHLAGKKHATQERASSNTGGTNAQQNLSKKRKVEEPAPAWCDVCKISCTSNDVLSTHLVGKKHQKSLRKLQNPNPNPITSVSTVASLPSQNPTTAAATTSVSTVASLPSQNPTTAAATSVSTVASLPSQNPTTAAATTPVPNPQQVKKKDSNDVETKKRNIIGCGASANAVRTCTICGVVCNSETVFNSHLAGQKHAAMVKQAEAAKASSGLQVVYPAL